MRGKKFNFSFHKSIFFPCRVQINISSKIFYCYCPYFSSSFLQRTTTQIHTHEKLKMKVLKVMIKLNIIIFLFLSWCRKEEVKKKLQESSFMCALLILRYDLFHVRKHNSTVTPTNSSSILFFLFTFFCENLLGRRDCWNFLHWGNYLHAASGLAVVSSKWEKFVLVS